MIKDNWRLKRDAGKNPRRLFSDLQLPIEEILLNRGVASQEDKDFFLYPDYENDLTDPFSISGMEKAVKRLKIALKRKERVCVYGDYDADGVTSSCLLKDFFDQIGLKNFCYIPDRNKEGYGINLKAFEFIKKQGTGLIITVDCGISNAEEIKKIKKEHNIDVIILDHHHLPSEIPDALAVINPKIDKNKRIEYLAGVGVAFKFIQAAASLFPEIEPEKLKWLLDLVAVGTIADCVPLLEENRILSKFGLLVLSKTRRTGLQQLFEVGRINIDESHIPSSQQVAFQIAPRINAAGRMDHANAAYKLLACLEGEEAKARVLALELESQNQHRQKVTNRIVQEVEEKIKHRLNEKIIIERSPSWDLGVVGLAAGKICEKYHCPTILLNKKEDLSRGSGRSIEEFNLIESLEEQKDKLKKYGGHRQAAGMTIDDGNYEIFKKTLKQKAKKAIPDDLVKSVKIDARIAVKDINEELVRQLSLLEPFGQGNPQPIFMSDELEVADKKLVGKESSHLKLWIKAPHYGKGFFEGIGFDMGKDYNKIKLNKNLSAIFNLEEDSWNGYKKIQLKLIDFAV